MDNSINNNKMDNSINHNNSTDEADYVDSENNFNNEIMNNNNNNNSNTYHIDNATVEATIKMFNYLTDTCSPIPLSIALINFPMNLTIMLIIYVQMRATSGRAHPGQIHLLFLAISDVSVGIFFVAGAIWLRFLPSDWRLIQVSIKWRSEVVDREREKE